MTKRRHLAFELTGPRLEVVKLGGRQPPRGGLVRVAVAEEVDGVHAIFLGQRRHVLAPMVLIAGAHRAEDSISTRVQRCVYGCRETPRRPSRGPLTHRVGAEAVQQDQVRARLAQGRVADAVLLPRGTPPSPVMGRQATGPAGLAFRGRFGGRGRGCDGCMGAWV